MAHTGRIALITGATSGIGRATAEALARQGLTVVLVARDPHKGRAVLDEIKTRTGSGSLDLLVSDLSSQASIRELAAAYKNRYDRLHVLVNNAGGFFSDRRTTVDGLELTFAFNHLAYFLLTNLLLDRLRAGAPARIVNVSSEAQAMTGLNFDDLQAERRYDGQRAYSQSKLANVVFTYALARRLAGSGVTANAVHPGVVRTNFGRENPSLVFRLLFPLIDRFMLTPEKGAATPIYLATSAEIEGVSGQYFANQKPKRSNPVSYDLGVQERLWEVSARLTHFSNGDRS